MSVTSTPGCPSLTLHADDVSRLEEVRHVVSRVGVYAAVAHLGGVRPGQADPPPLGLVLELVDLAEVEASSDDALCRGDRGERGGVPWRGAVDGTLRAKPGRQGKKKTSTRSSDQEHADHLIHANACSSSKHRYSELSRR